MKITSQDEVMRLIPRKILHIIRQAVSAALDKGAEFKRQYPHVEKRTVSTFINDCMCQNIENLIRELGAPEGDIYLFREYGALRLALNNGQVLFRFKKMRTAGATSNIPTQAVLEYEEQTQLTLFDDPPTVHMNAGYALINHGTEPKIMLSHPIAFGKIDWTYEIPALDVNVVPVSSYRKDTAGTETTTRKPRLKEGIKRNERQHSQS